jgi:hypothetical protein
MIGVSIFMIMGFSNILNTQVSIDTTKIEVVTWGNHEYAFIRNKKPNMIDAQCACNKLGMALVKIETEAENNFLQSNAFEKEGVQTIDGNQYWIGASDIEEEGDWVWLVDNSRFFNQKKMKPIKNAYENWGKTSLGIQPNNVLKNDEYENCAVLRIDGLWFDIGCKKRFAYTICEKQPLKK